METHIHVIFIKKNEHNLENMIPQSKHSKQTGNSTSGLENMNKNVLLTIYRNYHNYSFILYSSIYAVHCIDWNCISG